MAKCHDNLPKGKQKGDQWQRGGNIDLNGKPQNPLN